jgi:hypothetical protein
VRNRSGLGVGLGIRGCFHFVVLCKVEGQRGARLLLREWLYGELFRGI